MRGVHFITILLITCCLLTYCSSDEKSAAGDAEERLSLKNLSESRKPFKSRPYILAATKLQKMGKVKACNELERLAMESEDRGQVAILSRMLFTGKDRAILQMPAWGTPVYCGSTNNGDWPASPIEFVDGIPFFVVIGYAMSGVPEGSLSYFRYCHRNGEWTDKAYGEPSAMAMELALRKLLESKKWNRQLTEKEKEYFRSQIE